MIEFTPSKSGTFQYTYWMGMIRGNITVTDTLETSPTDPDKYRVKKQILKQNHFLTAPVWAAAEAKNIWNCMAKTCNEDV